MRCHHESVHLLKLSNYTVLGTSIIIECLGNGLDALNYLIHPTRGVLRYRYITQQ